jgi:hypothetical protein
MGCEVPQAIDRLLMLRALQYTKLIRKQDNMSGYMGKVLWVDLENNQFTEETIPEKIYQEYLSGMGLAAHLLYEHIPPDGRPAGSGKRAGVCLRSADRHTQPVFRPLDGGGKVTPDGHLG